jgi:hypothetical protein
VKSAVFILILLGALGVLYLISQDTSTNEGMDSYALATEDCSVSVKFPFSVRRWCSLIEEYAHKNEIDPDLVASIILVESSGNARAYSKSGAVGLMQVMPRDGLAAEFMCNNKPCFTSRPSKAELLDAEFNLSYGVRLLAGLFKKSGIWREALKSYGPMDVDFLYADHVLAIYNRYRSKL